MAQADTHFPKVRRQMFYVSPLISGFFGQPPHCFTVHITLATLSLSETDTQILVHWCYADEDQLGKSLQAMASGLECQHDVTRLL